MPMIRNRNHHQRPKTQLKIVHTTLDIIFWQFNVFQHKLDSPQARRDIRIAAQVGERLKT